MSIFKSSQKSLTISLMILPLYALADLGHPYIAASLGASFGSLSQNSPDITYAQGTLTDRYPLNDNTVVAPVFSLNRGYEFTGKDWTPSIMLGLGLYSAVSPYDFEGVVNETASGDDTFDLYDYAYEVSAIRLMVETQLTWEVNNILPFLQAGLGAAWVDMHDYQENPSFVPAFESHTQVNFAYQLGFGVGKAFNYPSTHSDMKHERIALGYRFVGLGKTSFGTRGSTYPYELDTGTLNTNDIYFSYTHLF